MNKHVFFDKYTVTVSAMLLGKNKFFSEGIETQGFDQHLAGVELQVPKLEKEGLFEVNANSLAGQLDPAYYVAQWLGPEYPTIIYHH